MQDKIKIAVLVPSYALESFSCAENRDLNTSIIYEDLAREYPDASYEDFQRRGSVTFIASEEGIDEDADFDIVYSLVESGESFWYTEKAFSTLYNQDIVTIKDGQGNDSEVSFKMFKLYFQQIAILLGSLNMIRLDAKNTGDNMFVALHNFDWTLIQRAMVDADNSEFSKLLNAQKGFNVEFDNTYNFLLDKFMMQLGNVFSLPRKYQEALFGRAYIVPKEKLERSRDEIKELVFAAEIESMAGDDTDDVQVYIYEAVISSVLKIYQ